MTARAGQATVEWLAVVGVACVIVAVLAGTSLRRGDQLQDALQSAAGGIPVPMAPAPPSLGLVALDGVDGAPIVAIARRLAASGIAEFPPGSNRGPDIDDFTGGRAEPWCADFVSWVVRAAGRPLSGGEDGWRIAWTGGVRDWFAARGRFRERLVADPRPGDVVWFVHGHVGIVTGVRGTTLETVEGNSGNAVRARAYPRWRMNPDIGGFGRLPDG